MVRSTLKMEDKIIKYLYIIALVYYIFLMFYYTVALAYYSVSSYNDIHTFKWQRLATYIFTLLLLIFLIFYNIKCMRDEKFNSWEKIRDDKYFLFWKLYEMCVLCYEFFNVFQFRMLILTSIFSGKSLFC